MKVKVYWNLHKKVFSVMDAKTRRVIDHQNIVVLDKVSFKVSECGRKKVLKEKRKNVHAFVCGEIGNVQSIRDEMPREAFYNPYKTKTFVDKKTGKPLSEVSTAYMVNKKVYYWR